MRRLNSDFSDKSGAKWKTPYLNIIMVGTIQFFLSLLILCYGVFLMQFVVKDLFNLETSLWTVIAFIAAFKVTNPWVKTYCQHLDNIRHRVHKRNIIATVILLFGDLVSLSFYNTEVLTIICYGLLGGLFSSIIHGHLKSATAESFRQYPNIFSILDHLMKSFCLLLMPHLILFLTNMYGTTQFFLILAGAMLNIIPASLLVRTKKYQKVPLCKFQTVDRLSVEMIELKSKPTDKEASSSDEEEEEEETGIDDSDKEEESGNQCEKTLPVSSSTVQRYYQNVGVKILPNIPEESDLEDDDDINEITSKRLSKISAILQGINENTHKDVNLSVNNLYQPDEIIETVEPEVLQFINEPEPKKRRCFSISSNRVFNWRMKKQKLKTYLYRNVIKAVPKILTSYQLYPALVSHCITTTFSTVVLATAPYLMFFNNEHRQNGNTPEESTFLLTIIGFTWLFFLAGYPVVNRLSPLKTTVLFLVGLAILGLSLFIVHKFDYDNFVLFSMMFGLGHGLVSYAENIVNENFCGKAKWRLLRGPLEILTGLFVILIYLIIYLSNLDIYGLISNGYWFYFSDVIMWSAVFVTKRIVTYCKSKAGRYNVEKFSNFNF